MSTPTKDWRRYFDRFDRKLGFVIGAVVGFLIASFTAAAEFYATGQQSLLAGAVGAVALGVLVAVFGDRVLEWLAEQSS